MEYGLGRDAISACSMWVWDYAPEINSNVNVEIVRFLAFYKGKTDDDINFQHSRGLRGG